MSGARPQYCSFNRLLKYSTRTRGTLLGEFDFYFILSHRELLALSEPIFIVLSLVITHFLPSRRLQTDFSQRAHTREVVGRHCRWYRRAASRGVLRDVRNDVYEERFTQAA